MIKVLNITGILPIPELEKKKDENDILLVVEKELTERQANISFNYLFVFPKANFLLGQLSRKWNSYYNLGKKRQAESRGKLVNLIALIMLPKRFWFREHLYNLSFWLNKTYIDQLIQDLNPTIIHAQNIESDAYLARKISVKYNIPYVVTLRGWKDKIDSFQYKNLKGAQFLVAISPKQQIHFTHLNREISFIPHGLSQNFLSSKNVYPSLGPLKIVVVARLLSNKNIDKVILALSRVKEDFVFHIYGDGPERLQLENLIFQLGLSKKIKLKGKIAHEELPKFLVRYNLFVMPSFPETLGRAYFEAMACGLPVIGSRLAGVDGIITQSKEGFLVQPHVDDIEKTLKRIFQNPEQLLDMRRSALELAKQYSWDNISKKYLLLYNYNRETL